MSASALMEVLWPGLRMPEHGGWQRAHPMHKQTDMTHALAWGVWFVRLPFSDTLRSVIFSEGRPMKVHDQ